jgi:hypothetical protein
MDTREAGKKRWVGKTAAERRLHAQKMVTARREKVMICPGCQMGLRVVSGQLQQAGIGIGPAKAPRVRKAVVPIKAELEPCTWHIKRDGKRARYDANCEDCRGMNLEKLGRGE